MRHLISAPFLLLFAVGCAHEKADYGAETTAENQNHLIQSTLFVQSAAEYDALCYQAFEVAKMRLIKIMATAPERATVVLDLDETVLDNSPYTGWQVLSGNTYTPETWAKWVALAEAEPVPGAIAFLHFADSLGFALFYISNRDAAQLGPTLENLGKWGAPQADSSRVLLKTDTGNKDSRRDSVRSLGYEIVMLIGDNLGDFSSKWDKPAGLESRKQDALSEKSNFGTRYIVLPNPVYGTWEGALNDYNRDLTPSATDSLRLNRLKTVNLPE